MKELITHHIMQSSASLNPTQTSATWDDTKHSALNLTSFADNRTLMMMMKNQRGERECVLCVCFCKAAVVISHKSCQFQLSFST